jgi:hypothetical protein
VRPGSCARETSLDLAQGLAWERRSPEVFVEGYVARQNIDHYRAMLKSITDLEQRRIIENLLREEEAKLEKYNEDPKPNSRNQVA